MATDLIQVLFVGEESDSIEGLSKLVSLCLGVSLDKSEQFSNWDRRPLRDAQKYYAGMFGLRSFKNFWSDGWNLWVRSHLHDKSVYILNLQLANITHCVVFMCI